MLTTSIVTSRNTTKSIAATSVKPVSLQSSSPSSMKTLSTQRIHSQPTIPPITATTTKATTTTTTTPIEMRMEDSFNFEMVDVVDVGLPLHLDSDFSELLREDPHHKLSLDAWQNLLELKGLGLTDLDFTRYYGPQGAEEKEKETNHFSSVESTTTLSDSKRPSAYPSTSCSSPSSSTISTSFLPSPTLSTTSSLPSSSFSSHRFYTQEMQELLAPYQKLMTFSELFSHTKHCYGREEALDLFRRWILGELELPANDQLGVPYHATVSVAPLVRQGITFNRRLRPHPPNDTRSFIEQVVELIACLSQEVAESLTLSDFFIYYSYFLQREGVQPEMLKDPSKKENNSSNQNKNDQKEGQQENCKEEKGKMSPEARIRYDIEKDFQEFFTMFYALAVNRMRGKGRRSAHCYASSTTSSFSSCSSIAQKRKEISKKPLPVTLCLYDELSLDHELKTLEKEGKDSFPNGTPPNPTLIMALQTWFGEWITQEDFLGIPSLFQPDLTVRVTVNEQQELLAPGTLQKFCEWNAKGEFTFQVVKETSMTHSKDSLRIININIAQIGQEVKQAFKNNRNCYQERIVHENNETEGNQEIIKESLNNSWNSWNLWHLFYERLDQRLEKAYHLLQAYRSWMKQQIRRGACPFFQKELGYLKMDQFTLTVGLQAWEEGVSVIESRNGEDLRIEAEDKVKEKNEANERPTKRRRKELDKEGREETKKEKSSSPSSYLTHLQQWIQSKKDTYPDQELTIAWTPEISDQDWTFSFLSTPFGPNSPFLQIQPHHFPAPSKRLEDLKSMKMASYLQNIIHQGYTYFKVDLPDLE